METFLITISVIVLVSVVVFLFVVEPVRRSAINKLAEAACADAPRNSRARYRGMNTRSVINGRPVHGFLSWEPEAQ